MFLFKQSISIYRSIGYSRPRSLLLAFYDLPVVVKVLG